MDLLPPSTSENISTRTGGRFTVRSANSPSYSFNRRPGFRKRPSADNLEYTNATDNKEDMSGISHTELSHKHGSERKHPAYGTDVVGTQLFNIQERTEGKKVNLTSRHLSLDRGLEFRSASLSSRGGVSKLLGKREAGGLKEQKKGIENNPRGVSSSLKGFNSASPSHIKDNTSINQDIAERTNKNNSLPFRIRTESASSSSFTEWSLGSQGGQSIQERIQKLFGSAGETIVGGTFPRRFSSSEDYSPVRKTVPSLWAQKETDFTSSETLASPDAVQLKERSTGIQRQGQLNSKYLEEDKRRRETVEMGTKSLDRARSRKTVASHIRSFRAAGSMAQSQTFVEDTLSIFQQSKANINQEDSRENTSERMKVRESNIERNEETKQQTGLKRETAEDDVFDESPWKGTLQSTERKRPPELRSLPSSTSVRSKISQFEALTQRATSQVQVSRRIFSAPTHLFEIQEGMKRRGSAKHIGEQNYKQEGKGDEREEVKKEPGSERSLSVDELIISLGRLETDGVHLLDKNKKDFSEDISKNCSPKKNLHIPLNQETQRRSELFCFDETDSVKHSSPKDSNIKNINITSNVQPRPQREITSPVSEDDQTPTNTPLNTPPFLSPVKQPEDIFPVADNTTRPVVGKKDKTKDTDSTLLLPIAIPSQNSESDVFITHKEKTEDKREEHLPSETSSQNSDVFYPDVQTKLPKGRKRLVDLKVWIAGLNPEYKSWNDYMEEYDDDESTQKDDDSNYDSDSGESSVTITSNMSQSENKSFSLSLSDLCNFSGADYESDNDIDDWQLTGRRSVSLSSDVSAFSCVSLLPTEELDKLVEDVKNLGDEALQDYDDVQVVVLHKEVGVGLGFSLAGGVDQNKPITVHKVFNSGVAAQEGSIREGDRVLSINGTALSETGHWDALKTLRKAKARDMAVVVLRKGDLSHDSKLGVQESNEMATTTHYETGQCVCVQLQKNGRDLGFSLFGGIGSSEGNRPLTVKTIFPGGPVDKVYPGDEILEIQGTSVVQMRRPEVWSFIKSLASGPVEVVLRRQLKVTEL